MGSNAVNPRVQIHKELCKELHDLYIDKNTDYGDSFAQVRDEIPNAILVRLSDKLNRLKSLMNKSEDERKVKDESVNDTLMDIANYALLELVERRYEEDKEEAEEEDDEPMLSANPAFHRSESGMRDKGVISEKWFYEDTFHVKITYEYRLGYEDYYVRTEVFHNSDRIADDYIAYSPERFK